MKINLNINDIADLIAIFGIKGVGPYPQSPPGPNGQLVDFIGFVSVNVLVYFRKCSDFRARGDYQ